MEIAEVRQIHLSDIDAKTRPKLADMLGLVDGSAYLLSSEQLSEREGDERLFVLLKSEDNLGLIEDVPADEEAGEPEQYKAMVLDEAAIKSLIKLIAPPPRVRKESTGRPVKYHLEEEGMYIFFQHTYEGQTIQSLANDYHMSPTTVQKFLNQARMQAADNIVSGSINMDVNSQYYKKNLGVLKWAIKHSRGAAKQRYKNKMADLEAAEAAGNDK